ncbi:MULTISPECIES: hypothetical protein [unclassified Streptomyces]
MTDARPYTEELTLVRDIRAETDGAHAWGGGLADPEKSRFELAYKPATRR